MQSIVYKSHPEYLNFIVLSILLMTEKTFSRLYVKFDLEGGGRHPGEISFLKGGDTGDPDVWVRVMGNVINNDEGGGGHPCGVLTSDHG